MRKPRDTFQRTREYAEMRSSGCKLVYCDYRISLGIEYFFIRLQRADGEMSAVKVRNMPPEGDGKTVPEGMIVRAVEIALGNRKRERDVH